MSITVAWAVVGIGLAIAEVFTGTFVLLFFGASALLVSGARWLLGLDNLPLEVALFGALGLGLSFTLRKRMRAILKSGTGYRPDDFVAMDRDLAPGETANISYQGTVWTAVNEGDRPLTRGERARVVRTEGVRLYLTSEK